MKFLGILCLFLSSAAVGMFLASRLNERVRLLLRMQKMLQKIISLLEFQNLPSKGIFRELALSGLLTGLGGTAFTETENPAAVWQEEAAKNPLLQKGELKIISNIASILGSSDRQTQIDSFQLELEELRKLTAEAEEERQSKGKLYRSGGILLGLLLGIFLV